MPVREAQSKIDSAEFSEWMAFHNIEQFTLSKTDHLLSTVCAILANVHRAKNSKVYKPSDFMPTVSNKPKRDTASEMEIKLRAMFP